MCHSVISNSSLQQPRQQAAPALEYYCLWLTPAAQLPALVVAVSTTWSAWVELNSFAEQCAACTCVLLPLLFSLSACQLSHIFHLFFVVVVMCCRPLYEDDGHFAMFHIGNWQHALMYGGVAISGLVDVIGFYVPLPVGTEQVGGVGSVCHPAVAVCMRRRDWHMPVCAVRHKTQVSCQGHDVCNPRRQACAVSTDVCFPLFTVPRHLPSPTLVALLLHIHPFSSTSIPPPPPFMHAYKQAFLAIAFLVETLLMGMHTKPNPLDALVHHLLTGVMVSCVVVCTAEIAAPNSLLLALLRPMMVFFQGTWFWHVGAIMFKST